MSSSPVLDFMGTWFRLFALAMLVFAVTTPWLDDTSPFDEDLRGVLILLSIAFAAFFSTMVEWRFSSSKILHWFCVAAVLTATVFITYKYIESQQHSEGLARGMATILIIVILICASVVCGVALFGAAVITRLRILKIRRNDNTAEAG